MGEGWGTCTDCVGRYLFSKNRLLYFYQAYSEFARIESPSLPTFSKYGDNQEPIYGDSGGGGGGGSAPAPPQARSGGGTRDFYSPEFSLPAEGQQPQAEGDLSNTQRPRYTTTYEELRKENRDEFSAKQREQSKQVYMNQIPAQQQNPVARPKPPTQPFFTDRPDSYGDVGFEGGKNTNI